MKLIHARRILRLAKQMDRVKRSEFDISTWKSETVPVRKGQETPECGTTCCVLGWACNMPVFRRIGLGFKYDHSRHEDGLVRRQFKVVFDPVTETEQERAAKAYLDGLDRESWVSSEIQKAPRRYVGFDAGSAFFGLTQDEADKLFTSEAYLDGDGREEDVTPKVVAKRLRFFVKEKVGNATYRKLVRRKKAAVAA